MVGTAQNPFVLESIRDDELLDAVLSTQSLARPPISGFRVGAIGVGLSGRAYRGVNLEFPGLPLHHSVHAEQFVVANAALHGERQLLLLAVSAAPCGHCRQFLQELRGAERLRVLILSDPPPEDDDSLTLTLDALLPRRFGPQDILQGQDFPLILDPRDNRLSLSQDPPAMDSRLAMAALEAANQSHAPYTDSPAGLALRTRNGSICWGSYMESAAYNPGLPPLQAAIVSFIATGGGSSYEDIERAVLVERKDSLVQFAETSELVLRKISPKCTFHAYHARDSSSSSSSTSSC